MATTKKVPSPKAPATEKVAKKAPTKKAPTNAPKNEASNAPDIIALSARIGRLEMGGWVERAVLVYLLYLSWDRVPEIAAVVGSVALGLLVVFALIERARQITTRP